MNIKLRLSILFGLFVAVIMGLVSLVVYFEYADFRVESHFERIREKAFALEKEIPLIQEVEPEVVDLLYKGEIWIFDKNDSLIYSNNSNESISPETLKKIREEKEYRYWKGEAEVIGVVGKRQEKNAVIVVSVIDKSGRLKLRTIGNLLFFGWLTGVFIAFGTSYFYVRQIFSPIEIMNLRMFQIHENNLDERLPVKNNRDEFSVLASNFNRMLDRLSEAFRFQKEFVQHVSHEIRTPIATTMAQIESALGQEPDRKTLLAVLESVYEDQQRLAGLVNSFLLLARLDKVQSSKDWPILRIDEVLFSSIESFMALYPGISVKMDMDESPDNDSRFLIKGNIALLQSLFSNVLENAAKYADSPLISISVEFPPKSVLFHFQNDGPVLDETEQKDLFSPFFRGNNSQYKKGFGLGLSIVTKILQVHNAHIKYSVKNEKNCFSIKFPQQSKS